MGCSACAGISKHPSAEDRSRVQAGSGAEQANPVLHAWPPHLEKPHEKWAIWGCRLSFGLLGAQKPQGYREEKPMQAVGIGKEAPSGWALKFEAGRSCSLLWQLG